ncbi:NAD(P)-binding protein [Sporormia fimetaria CBS 119925]|uniref:NAD(P)-binding protein n=1 Tax=Sporormia fimetaria CBS 119925 TaxID=1340428 RepID=A0A6A6VRH5_9PLEO|nr:NAD(P)-binding protein [Sporormia fimetaria CBS 119925]
MGNLEDSRKLQQYFEPDVAIVTGSSRGIGAGLAIEVTVVYTSSNSASLAEGIVKKITELGSRAIAVRADLSQPLLDTTADDFAKIYDINVRGALLMTKAVVPYLRAPGRIIDMLSVGSRSGFLNLALYCSSKAALEGLTRCLAAQLGEAGHTMNAVLPGPTESDILDTLPEESIKIQIKATPVQHRVAHVEDIAKVVAWLAEGESGWISGQRISATGGYMML